MLCGIRNHVGDFHSGRMTFVGLSCTQSESFGPAWFGSSCVLAIWVPVPWDTQALPSFASAWFTNIACWPFGYQFPGIHRHCEYWYFYSNRLHPFMSPVISTETSMCTWSIPKLQFLLEILCLPSATNKVKGSLHSLSNCWLEFRSE